MVGSAVLYIIIGGLAGFGLGVWWQWRARMQGKTPDTKGLESKPWNTPSGSLSTLDMGAQEGVIQRHAELSRRLELAMKYAGMGMFEHQNGSEFALFDQGMIDLYQFPHEPGLIKVSEWLERVHPDDMPTLLRSLQQTSSNEKLHETVDFRAILPDGRTRDLRANWVTELDDAGNVARIIGTHSDLTDIREAERTRFEASERLALISDNLPGAVIQRAFVNGKLGDLIHVSPNAERIWGYTAEEILADPKVLVDAHDPESQPVFVKRKEEALKARVPLIYRYRITTRTGETRWVEYRGSPPRRRDDNTEVVEAIFLDITEEVETRQQVERIVANLPGVVFQSEIIRDQAARVTYISSRSKDIWGYEPDEIMAEPGILAQVHDPEDIGDFLAKLDRGVCSGEPIHHRYRITAKNGQKRWLDFFGQGNMTNGHRRLDAIVLDATKEVQAREQAEKEREVAFRAQKNESIGQLTGGMAHDFNNLLAVVLGNLELLKDHDDPSEQKEHIDEAIEATLRGAELTRSLLSFARRAKLDPKVLDINDTVRKAKNWISRTLPESTIVETSLLAGLWKTKVDPNSLESAILNVVLNGRDAMDGIGRLTIETANVRIDQPYIDARNEELEPGRYVMLAISDTGAGVPEEVLEKIFDPFFTTKELGSGTGLGLSMVLGFMRQSGCTVQVYTEEGSGTTFKLYFPVVDSEEQSLGSTNPEPVGQMPGVKRILLAEDEPKVRKTLVSILTRADYEVVDVTSGDEALEVFKENPDFDLLVTDIVMPGELQGTTLGHAVREIAPTLPIVFMSGYAREAAVHGNGLRPEDIRLMKPVQRSELLSAVTAAINPQS